MFRLENKKPLYIRSPTCYIVNVLLQTFLKPGGKVLISDYCCSEGEHTQPFKDYVRTFGYSVLSQREYCSVSTVWKARALMGCIYRGEISHADTVHKNAFSFDEGNNTITGLVIYQLNTADSNLWNIEDFFTGYTLLLNFIAFCENSLLVQCEKYQH